MKTSQSTTSERKEKTSTPILSNVDITKKLILMKKSMRIYNNHICLLKRRLQLLTKEVKNIKKQQDDHIQKMKKADRIDRKMDTEKKKLKRKVLKAGAPCRKKK